MADLIFSSVILLSRCHLGDRPSFLNILFRRRIFFLTPMVSHGSSVLFTVRVLVGKHFSSITTSLSSKFLADSDEVGPIISDQSSASIISLNASSPSLVYGRDVILIFVYLWMCLRCAETDTILWSLTMLSGVSRGSLTVVSLISSPKFVADICVVS